MPEKTPISPDDRLGLLNAHVQHMKEGCCCDEIPDERLFPGQILRILSKIELTVDENFGGDISTFHLRMLMRIAVATLEQDDPLLAIEHWLDVELKESEKLYN